MNTRSKTKKQLYRLCKYRITNIEKLRQKVSNFHKYLLFGCIANKLAEINYLEKEKICATFEQFMKNYAELFSEYTTDNDIIYKTTLILLQQCGAYIMFHNLQDTN